MRHPVADQATGRRGDLPDRSLPVVAAGGVAVLPHPDLEDERPTGHRPMCNQVQPTRGHRGRGDPAGPARPATRTGDPVRDAVPPRRAHEQNVPHVVMQVVGFLATTTVTSLLDQDEDAWRAQIGRPAPKDSKPRALLIYAWRRVEDLVDTPPRRLPRPVHGKGQRWTEQGREQPGPRWARRPGSRWHRASPAVPVRWPVPAARTPG